MRRVATFGNGITVQVQIPIALASPVWIEAMVVIFRLKTRLFRAPFVKPNGFARFRISECSMTQLYSAGMAYFLPALC